MADGKQQAAEAGSKKGAKVPKGAKAIAEDKPKKAAGGKKKAAPKAKKFQVFSKTAVPASAKAAFMGKCSKNLIHYESMAKPTPKQIMDWHCKTNIESPNHAQAQGRRRVKTSIIRKITSRLLDTYGEDVSRLQDLFHEADSANKRHLDRADFQRVLSERAGLNLASKDLDVLARAYQGDNRSGVHYDRLLDDLAQTARAVMPDTSVHQVNGAHRRRLAMQRMFGSRLLAASQGNPRLAFSSCKGGDGRVTGASILAHLERNLGMQVSAGDRAVLIAELKRAAPRASATGLNESAFSKVVLGQCEQPVTHALWEDEAKFDTRAEFCQPRDLEQARVAAKLRDWAECRRHSLRDVYLQVIDRDRNGPLTAEKAVANLSRLGLSLTPAESQTLQRLIATNSGTCTFDSFAKPMASEEEKSSGLFPWQPRKSQPALVSSVFSRKSVNSAYLLMKQGQPLPAEDLYQRLCEADNATSKHRNDACSGMDLDLGSSASSASAAAAAAGAAVPRPYSAEASLTTMVQELHGQMSVHARESELGQGDFWTALSMSMIAGLATGVGALSVVLLDRKPKPKHMAFSMALAGAVMLTVSVFDMYIPLVQEDGFLYPTLVAIGGGLIFDLLLRMLPQPERMMLPQFHRKMAHKNDDEMTPAQTSSVKQLRLGMIMMVTLTAHNFPEGLAVSMANIKSDSLGFVVTLAIALHNVPEGLAIAVPIYAATGRKFYAIGMALLSGLSEPLGAAIALTVFQSYFRKYPFLKNAMEVEANTPSGDMTPAPTTEEDDTFVMTEGVPVVASNTEKPNVPKRRNRRKSVSAECFNPAEQNAFVPVIVEKSAEERERIERAVDSNFLFSSLDEEQRNQVFGAMVEKTVDDGAEIIAQGAAGDFFYVLDQGSADVFVDGTKVLTYNDGSSFGELALMYNCPRAATVKATSPCVLWALDRQAFQHILYANQSAKRSKYDSFLQSCALFANLEKQEISRIADVLVEQQFDAGSVIISEGDDNFAAMKFYIVISGEVEAFKGEDRSVVVGRSGPGDFFGEKALIESKPRAASVVAKTPVQCAYLDIAAFERLLGSCKTIMRRQIDTYNVAIETSPPAGSAVQAARALTPSSASSERISLSQDQT
ncbi:cAMP-dependent protein kinase regulatory subunit [Hondaea fermentalgiana]|uniref:cAMP-dependent protein kinase regulatory subunit n=1 Tax=Hondaea fermentalgiana TaxID=2315210 RepID=A0A2R5GI03_9STRA|nr:cAMP-dependent protein kinase regulatory subunit [Hondaea fermentalgiana]|eukprot:GBG27504.1 cAMP-dependent protein kinase regulatory subunit [Hondaea fermentalgiana]